MTERPHSVFSVRDFGYPPTEELHYGVGLSFDDDSYAPFLQDGPPWLEDHTDTSTTDDSEIHGKAIALFDFEPENDNEVRLKEGQVIWISYRHGQGWLVAEDEQGESGLVPEEYVQIVYDEEPKQMLKGILPSYDTDSDWVDEDEDELPKLEKLDVK